MSPDRKSDVYLGFEISPTAIVEYNNIVFVPTQICVAVALDRKNGNVLWKQKISNALLTHLLPVPKNHLLVTTMDGKVSLLEF